jgi:eukaryotic-like serine/threonine-protein kinase
MSFTGLFWRPETTADATLDLKRNYKFSGRFKLVRYLDKGGFGQVWEAKDELLNEIVALKISNEDLKNETLALRRLPKDRYVSIFDYVSDDNLGACAYSMELLNKPWMTWNDYRAKYIAPQFEMPNKAIDTIRTVSLIGVELLESLKVLHGNLHGRKNRWVHADIKPNNVYIHSVSAKRAFSQDGCMPGPFIKIGDLGLSRLAGAVAGGGTPGYRAPEQESGGTLSAATDLFAVGQTLAFMVMGTTFDASALKSKKRMKKMLAEFIPSAHLVEAYTKVIRKMTLTTPALRGTASETMKLLKSLMSSNEEWIVLRTLAEHQSTGLNLSEATESLFSEIKSSKGWKYANEDRRKEIRDIVRSMYKREILELSGHKYFVKLPTH